MGDVFHGKSFLLNDRTKSKWNKHLHTHTYTHQHPLPHPSYLFIGSIQCFSNISIFLLGNWRLKLLIVMSTHNTWVYLVGLLNVCPRFGEKKKNEMKIIFFRLTVICCFTSLIRVSVQQIKWMCFIKILSNGAFSPPFSQLMWTVAHVSLRFRYTKTARNNFNLQKIAKINAK